MCLWVLLQSRLWNRPWLPTANLERAIQARSATLGKALSRDRGSQQEKNQKDRERGRGRESERERNIEGGREREREREKGERARDGERGEEDSPWTTLQRTLMVLLKRALKVSFREDGNLGTA